MWEKQKREARARNEKEFFSSYLGLDPESLLLAHHRHHRKAVAKTGGDLIVIQISPRSSKEITRRLCAVMWRWHPRISTVRAAR